MNNKFNKLSLWKKASSNQIEKWSNELIVVLSDTIKNEAVNIEKYVNQLRRLNPEINDKDLVEKIISRKSLRSGSIGAICGLGGILTMPITMPADMYYSFKIQARLVLSIAFIYGWDLTNEETATDILLVMGGNVGINALKKAGIKLGEEFVKKGVEKLITREVMKKINRIVSRKIITKAGEKSLTSFTKMIPLIGAPIGGTIDYFSTKAVGKTALMFYKG